MGRRIRTITMVRAMERELICNIWNCTCEVVLFNGDQLCPWCKGQGAKFGKIEIKKHLIEVHRCRKCDGHGKIGWIERITHKKPKFRYYLGRTKKIRLRCTGHNKCKNKLLKLAKRESKNIGITWVQVYMDISWM